MPEQSVLIIGGGPAGMEAARGIADLGYQSVLVEQRPRLGGMPDEAGYAALTPDFRSAAEAMAEMASAIENNPLVDIRLNSTVTAASGGAGDFEVTLKNGEALETVKAGAVIVATGFQHFDPGRETQQYGYYEHDDVITLVDLEKMLRAHNVVRPSNGQPPERLCFIQCVGSRDRQIGNEYCSKVCCGVASKEAIEVRQQLPDCKVFIFYIDMRMYGYWENLIYWPAQEKYKVNYIKGIATEIVKKGDRLLVRGEDTTMGRPMEVPMDLVVLSVGMEPSDGTREMAKIFGLKLNKYNFIETVGGALNTVATSVAGVFACGASTGPADLEDSISSASAAAIKALAAIRRGPSRQRAAVGAVGS
ncbi:MAG: CoB--CoM heterodisulfide reductase iron-sulfur subunit A family protein [Acidobacteria bacterium]|nr:CoB--CoM heterodisulfide reductase iron-sulfur subunit A family protein [Acidobacteriota bacterium]